MSIVASMVQSARTWFWFMVARRWKNGRYRIQHLAWRGISGQRVVRDVYGCRYRLDLNEFVDCHIFLNGTFERESIDALRDLALKRSATGFIDVGAYNGVFSLPMARCRGIARVWSFEADPENFDRLRANIKLNAVAELIEAHHVAVSSSPGEAELHISDARKAINEFKRNQGTSSIEYDPNRHTRTMRVPKAPLDALLDLTGQRLLVKIDIERHELDALHGMQRLLESNQCVILIEVFPERFTAVNEWLSEHGFAQSAQYRLEEHNYIYEQHRD